MSERNDAPRVEPPMQEEESNPFAPPGSDLVEPDLSAPARTNGVKEVVNAWEAYRIPYNLWLLLAGVLVLLAWVQTTPFWILLPGALAVATGANLCFFAGPLVEFYLCAKVTGRIFTEGQRRALYLTGLIGSLVLFVLVGGLGILFTSGSLLPTPN